MVAEAQACLPPFHFFFEAVLKILPKTAANQLQFSLKIIQGIRSHSA